MMKRMICTAILCTVCYLGLHNGYLAIFDDESNDPLMVFPYQGKNYPAKDQIALNQGIPYQTQEELSNLLEDFLS